VFLSTTAVGGHPKRGTRGGRDWRRERGAQGYELALGTAMGMEGGHFCVRSGD